MRIALVYDMDACLRPTGVTRHALAQLEQLARRPEIDLKVISGRIHEPDGLAYWDSLGDLPRCEFPIRTRDMLRYWRMFTWPPIDLWSGTQDWVYCPAEYFLPARKARRAVTSHDVLQDLQFGSARRRMLIGQIYGSADLILSVSQFNTTQLLEAFPDCRGKVAYVPNGAEDLFFEPATERERAGVRADLGLPPGIPYLLSVANFQPRKNLERLVRAAARLPEVAAGELALVLLGAGSDDQARTLQSVIAEQGRKSKIVTPGYRQGKALRAIYAEAFALVFPSLCESFGIPAVEAMAQGCPVALSNTTALPEIGGDAGWYFDPEREDAIEGAIRDLLDRSAERATRVNIGKTIAATFHWRHANDLLVAALQQPIRA